MGVGMRNKVVLIMASLALTSCGAANVGCADEEATKLAITLLKDGVQSDVVEKFSGGDMNSRSGVTPTAVRAVLDKISFSIEDVRTAAKSDTTTAKECKGTLKIKFPVDVLNSANQARSQAGLNTVRQMADLNGLQGSPDAFSHEINYTVQPTDDGKKIYTEINQSDPHAKFVSEVVANHLSAAAIQRLVQEQQATQQRMEAEQKAAEDAQRKANLQLATAEYKLSIQVIDSIWKSVDPNIRQQLLPIQRAWIAKTKADCRIEAAGASTEPDAVEATRLMCEARQNNARSNELRQYVNADNGSSF